MTAAMAYRALPAFENWLRRTWEYWKSGGRIFYDRGVLFYGKAAAQIGHVRAFDAERAHTDTAERENAQAKRLLDAYENAMLRLAYSYLHNYSDAEDMLQEALLQYLKKRPVFESGAHEKAWLLTVTANLCKNRIKYNRLRETDELNEELVAKEREDLSFVWEAVKSLPAPYREVVHLYCQEGYATAQIAEILKRKEASVRSDLYRARAKLKDILKEAYDFEERIS